MMSDWIMPGRVIQENKDRNPVATGVALKTFDAREGDPGEQGSKPKTCSMSCQSAGIAREGDPGEQGSKPLARVRQRPRPVAPGRVIQENKDRNMMLDALELDDMPGQGG